MPRAFSLGLLMLVVTLLCMATGVAVRFPVIAIALLAVVGYLVPMVMVLSVVSRYTNQRRATWIAGSIGALVGNLFFSPVIMRMGPPRPFWYEYFTSYLAVAIPIALGALLLAAPLTIERVRD